jgi:hypothetical protein
LVVPAKSWSIECSMDHALAGKEEKEKYSMMRR